MVQIHLTVLPEVRLEEIVNFTVAVRTFCSCLFAVSVRNDVYYNACHCLHMGIFHAGSNNTFC